MIGTTRYREIEPVIPEPVGCLYCRLMGLRCSCSYLRDLRAAIRFEALGRWRNAEEWWKGAADRALHNRTREFCLSRSYAALVKSVEDD